MARPAYSMRQYLNLANIATSANLAAGFLSALLSLRAELDWAVSLVLLAAVFDAVDGPLARSRGTEGLFGANLDSLADVVSFGVAPAFAIYTGSLHHLPGVGVAVCLGLVLCGTWRLARFSLCKKQLYFVGCPMPVAGVLIALLAPTEPHPLLALTAVVVVSMLMISTVQVPTLARLRNRKDGSQLESTKKGQGAVWRRAGIVVRPFGGRMHNGSAPQAPAGGLRRRRLRSINEDWS